MKVLFSNGIKSWLSVDKVKDINLKIVTHFVTITDLEEVSKEIQRRWDRAFLSTLRRTTRRLRRVDSQGFNSYTHEPTPYQFSLNRYKRVRKEKTQASKKKKKSPSVRKTFKHDHKVPRTWNDVVRIEADAGSRHW